MKDFQVNDILYEVEINCSIDKLWRQWTTEEGLTSFLARKVHLDFRVEGFFEALFDLQAPPGQRGSEGMKILSYEEGKMFSFTWSAPPSIPAIRKQRTVVIINFFEKRPGVSALLFRNLGYGQGKDWQNARAYFRRAWGKVVLPRLKWSLEEGPVDWDNLPPIPYDFSGTPLE